MLFVVNKTRNDVLDLIRPLGGDEDKAVLLVGDAVYYAVPSMSDRFRDAGVEQIYVAQDALASRPVELHPDAEVVDYEGMAGLIMDTEDKVLCI